jgi:hypothetical protein
LNYPIQFYYQESQGTQEIASSAILPFEYANVPPEVEFQTFRSLFYETDDNSILVRVRSLSTSTPASIMLLRIFDQYEVLSIQETSLTMLYNTSTHRTLKFKEDGNKLSRLPELIPYSPIFPLENPGPGVYTLYPMEIKTFIVNLKYRQDYSPIPTLPVTNTEAFVPDPSSIVRPNQAKPLRNEVSSDDLSTNLYYPVILFLGLGTLLLVMRKRNRRQLNRFVKDILRRCKPKKTERLIV